MKGKLIVFEGADGTGTTTQSRLFADRLKESIGKDRVLLTYEPSNDVVGGLIRRMLSKELDALPPDGMAHLFCANRINHLHTVILPAIREGKFVVCDRFSPSTVVYQSVHLVDTIPGLFNDGLTEQRMRDLKTLVQWPQNMTSMVEPLITFWLVASQVAIASRLVARRTEAGLEGDELYEGIDTRMKIAELYNKYDHVFPGEFTRIDTEVGLKETAEECWQRFMDQLEILTGPSLNPDNLLVDLV